MERKLDVKCTRMLWAVLNKSLRQHSTKQLLYGHLRLISKTIQIRQTRYAGHYWRSKDKLISDVLQWTPSHGWASVGRPARTYQQQLCTDIGCSMEDMVGAMDVRNKWWKRVREMHASGTPWWWWYIYIYKGCTY